jgi:hypothetical protein
MSNLNEIIQKYPSSDKGSNYHDYLKFYEKHISKFNDSLTNMLEIGVYQGDSIRMWRDYFSTGNLVAIDILDLSHIQLPNTYIKVCDQAERDQLQELINSTFNSFDIIVDDGGHMMHQQQISLGYLFPFLNSGGVYVIEDLHTSGHGAYTRGDSDGHMLNILTEFASTGKITSNLMTDEEIAYIENNTEVCIIEQGAQSPIAFIIKK